MNNLVSSKKFKLAKRVFFRQFLKRLHFSETFNKRTRSAAVVTDVPTDLFLSKDRLTR